MEFMIGENGVVCYFKMVKACHFMTDIRVDEDEK